MKVIVAKNAGFCMGVRRAMEMVLNAASDRPADEIIHTYGPLIHNNQVLQMLEARGVRCLASLEDAKSGQIAIRAHGIPPKERLALKAQGLKIINATCPRVAKVQGIIKKHAFQGYSVVIVGDENHAEVIGLQGFADGRAHVLNRSEEIDQLPDMEKILVVAQTTQDERAFQAIAQRLEERYPGAKVYDTICDSTHNRQEEVRTLCDEVDAMVVVGGRQSANTQRLAEIAGSCGIPTFHVETAEELNREQLRDSSVVGVTAGASTPNWLLRQVVYELENIQPKGARSPAQVFARYLGFLVHSNLFVAVGAGCLSYSAAVLQGIKPSLVTFLVTVFYVFAMHVLNRYADKAARFNDPSRTAFYDRYRIPFFIASLGAAFLALLLSLTQGLSAFLALLSLTVFGLLYSVPIFPESWLTIVRVAKLKDIPASKTIFIAGGWTVVATLLPRLGHGWQLGWTVIFAMLVVFLIVFLRSALFDVLDVQGDRLVGEETIPIVLGEKRTRRLLAYSALLLVILLAAGPSLGLSTDFSYLLVISCVYIGFYLFVHKRELIRPGSLRFEVLVESSFYLTGALAFLYRVITRSL